MRTRACPLASVFLSRSVHALIQQECPTEIRARQQALQKPFFRMEQSAAYRSGDPVQAAAASVTKNDTDYISALAALQIKSYF